MSLVNCLQRANKVKRVFTSAEIQELRDLAAKNRETMEGTEAERAAVQALLDEALGELAAVEALIAEAMPDKAKPAAAPAPAPVAVDEVVAAAQETTDAQRQQAAGHAKDVGGRVVWQRGDLALVEGYSLLSGDSVYIAAKGDKRTRVDIKSFTGTGYSEAEKAELMKARADAVRAADELLARNPDGPFADAPLVFADDIPAAVQGVVRGWIGLLGLDGARIVVTTPASGAAMADGLAGKFRRIGKANLSGDNTNGTMQPLGGDDFHIAVRPGVSTLKALEVLAHELGHIVERRAFAQADAGTQQAIREAHAAWLKENGAGRALDMAQAMRAYRSGQTTGFSEDAKAMEAGAYWRSFGEWFADQVSRWATTQDKPVGVVEQFFKRLADRLRVFFTGERAKFKPDTTVAQWLDSLAKDVPPVEAAAPAAPAKIEDVGEKIGGARKDTAESGGTRAKKGTTDTRPAWARRFEISQIVTPGGMIGEVKDAGRWIISDTRNLDWMKMPKRVGRDTYATKEEAEAVVPIAAVSLKHRAVPSRDGKYEIWRDISDRKRVKVVDRQFDTRDEAMAYMLANAVQIVETNTTFGEADLPLPPDRKRTGPEKRTGNVTGADFKATFGLRGVEFGNWNNQDERQALMNDAWDGLMDLADVLNLPPKALGLNGDLALAFGARGHGLNSARAHYEPARTVINLTKEQGAGSLAHEWFHALDHYFGRQDGKASAEWVVGADGTRTLKVSGDGAEMVSSGFRGERSGVRPELRKAYEAMLRTMTKKAETYVEDTAKADKWTGIAREELAQALSSLRRELAEQKDVRYYKRNNKPASAELLAEFDAIAKQMLDGEVSVLATDWKTFVKGGDKPANARGASIATRWTNDSLERLSEIHKEVRGRSGFDGTNKQGVLDRLRGNMERYSQRLKMLADAQGEVGKVRAVPTDFAMNARDLDQGRGTDYWTTPHEMAARAFQGYVEDKIAERGGVSRFLNYAPENAAILTPWGFKRPYPAGEERKAINAALDAFVGEFKTREDDAGNVALFSRAPGRSVELEAADAVGREFWRKIDNGESFTSKEVLDALALNRRGPRRQTTDVALPESSAGVGQSVVRWSGEIAGFDGYRTSAAWDGDSFTVYVVPEELAADADLTDPDQARGKAIISYALTPTRDGRHEFSVNDVLDGSEAEQALIERGQLLPAGTPGKPYNRVNIGYTANKALTQEVVRRLALNIGKTPTPYYPQRDTGARAGQANSGRDFTADEVREKFSRTPGQPAGIPLADAEAVADAIRAAYPTGPQIVVVDDVAKAPESLLDQIRSAQAMNSVEGAYYKGRIYLFPQNVADIERLMFVGAHHEIRHAGLDALFGKRKGALLLSIAMSNPKVAAAARQKMADGLADSMVAATEEALADMPLEDMAKLNGWNKIVAAVRQWLRGMADRLRRNHPKLAAMIQPDQWTDNDIAALIQRAEDISRGSTVPARPGGAVFSRDKTIPPSTDTRRYQNLRWEQTSDDMQTAELGNGWVATIIQDEDGTAELSVLDPRGVDFGEPITYAHLGEARLAAPGILARRILEDGTQPGDSMAHLIDGAPDDGARFSRADQTQTPAFRRWFGDSKVVDAQGKPLVVYHGTPQAGGITEFNMNDGAAYFTSSEKVAGGYTAKRGIWLSAPTGSVVPAYVSLQNPLVVDALGKRNDNIPVPWQEWKPKTFGNLPANAVNMGKLVEYAKANGHDGAIVRNLVDTADTQDTMKSDVFVAFYPEQIKSATGNNGQYDPDTADIRFSIRAGTAKVTAQDLLKANGGVFGRAGETKQDRVRAVVDGSRPFWLGALTRDQIADMYGDELPPVREYDNLTRAMENERQSAAQKADELYEEWSKIDAEANDRLARLMLDATVAQVHPDRATLPEKATEEQKQAHSRLRVQFNLLPKDAQAMYGKVRDFHANTLKDLRAALEGRIARLIENGSERAVALAEIRARFDQYMQGGPYFPLHRFGDFLVVAERAKDGERVVAAYENAGEQQAAARALEADGFAVKLTMAKAYTRSMDGSAGKFIGDVLTAIDKMDLREANINGTPTSMKTQLLDDLNQLFIKALPDLSYRKHFQHRKGTAGFSADVMRGFASSAFHAAGHIARLNHGDKMTFALDDAYQQIKLAPEGDFTKAGQVLNEMALRHEAALNPNVSPLSALATQVGFVMYLGLSPAAGLINMMQVPMVALPYIGARYGFAKATAAMGRAYTDIMGAKPNAKNGFNAAQSPKLSADERRAISTLQDEGVIDLTQAHDLAAATTRDVGNQARNKASFAIARAMRIVGWTFHVPEVMNRQVTALMAYRLEMAKSGNEGKAMDAAREAIKRSQFDYASSNRARYMQGDIARVVTQFRQFSQNMTYFLGRAAFQALKGEDPEVRRIARQQLVATFLVTGAMAGSLGLPGLGFFAGLVEALVNAMGDDDDEPWDWKTAYRNMLADNFGKEWGEVMARGVPRALMPAWDISNRVSLGDLWWRDNSREGDSPREAFANDMSNILGPTAGTLLGWYTASDHMARGDYGKAVESVVPKFIRDPLKAWRESQDGITSYNGEPLLELTGPEVAGRFLGFAPSRASEMFEGRNAVMSAKTALDDRRQRLISQMAKARIDGDTDAVAELQQRIRDWNTENPKMAITGATIVRSVLNRRRNTANTEQGITLPDSKDFLRDRARFAEVD